MTYCQPSILRLAERGSTWPHNSPDLPHSLAHKHNGLEQTLERAPFPANTSLFFTMPPPQIATYHYAFFYPFSPISKFCWRVKFQDELVSILGHWLSGSVRGWCSRVAHASSSLRGHHLWADIRDRLPVLSAQRPWESQSLVCGEQFLLFHDLFPIRHIFSFK